MWQAITWVTGGLTLAAFLAAVGLAAFKLFITRQERLIQAATTKERSSLVKNTLEFFAVDPAGLTQEQQYAIAMEQIRARSRRFGVIAIVVAGLTVVGAVISIYGISRLGLSATPSPGPSPAGQKSEYSHGMFDDRPPIPPPEGIGKINEERRWVALGSDWDAYGNEIASVRVTAFAVGDHGNPALPSKARIRICWEAGDNVAVHLYAYDAAGRKCTEPDHSDAVDVRNARIPCIEYDTHCQLDITIGRVRLSGTEQPGVASGTIKLLGFSDGPQISRGYMVGSGRLSKAACLPTTDGTENTGIREGWCRP